MTQRNTRETSEKDGSPLNNTGDGETVADLILTDQSDGITEKTRTSLRE